MSRVRSTTRCSPKGLQIRTKAAGSSRRLLLSGHAIPRCCLCTAVRLSTVGHGRPFSENRPLEWIARQVPGLRQGSHVPRLSQGRGSLRRMRRGAASSPRGRLPRLSGDRDRRPFGGAARPQCRDGLSAGLLGARPAVAAADAGACAAADPACEGRGRRAAVAQRHARLRRSQEAARNSAASG